MRNVRLVGRLAQVAKTSYLGTHDTGGIYICTNPKCSRHNIQKYGQQICGFCLKKGKRTYLIRHTCTYQGPGSSYYNATYGGWGLTCEQVQCKYKYGTASTPSVPAILLPLEARIFIYTTMRNSKLQGIAAPQIQIWPADPDHTTGLPRALCIYKNGGERGINVNIIVNSWKNKPSKK